MHRGKALEALRHHLMKVEAVEEEISDTAIMAVAMLASLEEVLGDRMSHTMHRETMGRMVKAKGGLRKLRYDARYFVVSEAEMVWALESGYSVIPHDRSGLMNFLGQEQLSKLSQWSVFQQGFRSWLLRGCCSLRHCRRSRALWKGCKRKGRIQFIKDVK